jgi:galactokinase
MRTFFAPGRVNIIGDHIDYNGGMVMPAAISLGITATLTPRTDRRIYLTSDMDGAHPIVLDLDLPIHFDPARNWGNYPAGVIKLLLDANIPIEGADIHYTSTLPQGSGLSSSASIEVLTGFALMTVAGYQVNRIALALLCQKAENEFVGVQCGIMDQFAVAMGKKDQAILLNCSNLEYEYLPFHIGSYKLIILDTRKERKLAASAYNTRKKECEAALRQLKLQHPNLKNLCQASFQDIEEAIDHPILAARARHAVWENQYVYEAKDALEDGDLESLGECLDASHFSLSNDYEVSCDELDIIVDAARTVPDCIGARMTGAGFGGCAIALVHNSIIEQFKEYVATIYTDRTGLSPQFYVCDIADGVHEIV